MRALGFEPKKEEIKKMIADIDKEGSGMNSMCIIKLACVYSTSYSISFFFSALLLTNPRPNRQSLFWLETLFSGWFL